MHTRPLQRLHGGRDAAFGALLPDWSEMHVTGNAVPRLNIELASEIILLDMNGTCTTRSKRIQSHSASFHDNRRDTIEAWRQTEVRTTAHLLMGLGPET